MKTKKKWIKTESDKAAIRAGYWMNEARGRKICKYFPDILRHSKGKWAGKPFKLLKWEKEDLLMPLFGWEYKKTKIRRFNIGFVEVAKKNGKSTICAGIGTYLLGDNEQAPYSAKSLGLQKVKSGSITMTSYHSGGLCRQRHTHQKG